MILLSDLRNAKVCTTNGENLGRVHEVHCDKGRVIAIMCGPMSLIERLTAREKGRRIAWEYVKKLEDKRIIVVPDPPKRETSGSRNRQRTRRASAPRSKR